MCQNNNNNINIICKCIKLNRIMNSYGSVSLVSHAIYKILRYMNFFPTTEVPMADSRTNSAAIDDDTRITISNNLSEYEPIEPIEPTEPIEPREMCAMCVIINIL